MKPKLLIEISNQSRGLKLGGIEVHIRQLGVLWQKNLLIPSTLGFRSVAKKLANALLIYGSLEILHCGQKTCSYLLHMRFKFVAKNLADVFWLRDLLRISCCGKKTCCYILHWGFKFVAKKLADTFYTSILGFRFVA